MAIKIATNFDVQTNLPIDDRLIKDTIANRNAIPSEVRYVDMEVKVREDGETYVLDGGITDDCWVRKEAKSKNMGAYKWSVNSEASTPLDVVYELKDGAWVSTSKTLHDFETDDFNGVWFYVGNGGTDAGLTRYKLKSDGYTTTGYDIDGADGYLNCRDYVIWNGRWVRFNVYEAKASTVKNADGKYSAKSGVQGLMSPTDKAYLTDLINEYWGKTKMPVFTGEAHLCNWCRDDGIYLGGLGEDCGGHPPYTGGNKTNWVLFVFNNYPNNTNPNNHRLQIAYDVSNCLMYMRKGWISSNEWADWTALAYTHPSYTARTGQPTANQTPAFGGTFSVSQPISDATGHITAINTRIITIPKTEATQEAAGLMSASDKQRVASIEEIIEKRVIRNLARLDGFAALSGGQQTLTSPGKSMLVEDNTDVAVEFEGTLELLNATEQAYTFTYKEYDSASSSEMPVFVDNSIEIPPRYCLSMKFSVISYGGITTYYAGNKGQTNYSLKQYIEH